MRINILISGKAGQGIKSLAEILSKAFSKLGLYSFNYRMYQSLISGGHNFNIINVSEEPTYSFDREFDIAILFDKKSYENHKDKFKKDGIILHNLDIKEGTKIDNSKFEKAKNLVFGGAIFKILGLDIKILEKTIKQTYSGEILKKDLEAIKKGYENCKIRKKLNPSRDKNIRYLEGSEAVGIGAIESGLNVYYAYPMTPATGVLSFLTKNQNKYDYLTFQPESEISVSNASLGSSFSGAKTMMGTSGGGFDLMTEAISMQGMTQLPLVAYLAMRSGPSSGAATYTSQQDLRMALNSGHGDFSRIVVSPGDIKEAYKLTKQAFYLTEKHKILSIILSDKHLAESGFAQKINYYDLFLKNKRKVPGKDFVKTNSYTHDEKGNYTEDAKTIKLMSDKRKQKFENTKKEIQEKFPMYKVYGSKKSKKVIIGFGSTKGAIKDAISLKKIKNYKYLHLLYLSPFPEKIKKELKNKKIFVIENNITGQLADLIQEKTQIKIPEKNRILKYDERPFTPNEIAERLK